MGTSLQDELAPAPDRERPFARQKLAERLSHECSAPPAGEPGFVAASKQGVQVGPGGEKGTVDPELGGPLGQPGPGQGRDRTQAALELIARRRPEGAVVELETGLDSVEQPRVEGAFRPAPVQASCRSQLVDRGGGALGDGDDGEVGQDEPDRPIGGGRPSLAPGSHRLGDGP
jgi:hypothetical protein